MATASFLASQRPGGSTYVIGEAGPTNALYEKGFSMNEMNPDYVVVGETRTYSFEKIERAVNLVRSGAKLIGTNPDLTDPIRHAAPQRFCSRCGNRRLFPARVLPAFQVHLPWCAAFGC